MMLCRWIIIEFTYVAMIKVKLEGLSEKPEGILQISPLDIIPCIPWIFSELLFRDWVVSLVLYEYQQEIYCSDIYPNSACLGVGRHNVSKAQVTLGADVRR